MYELPHSDRFDLIPDEQKRLFNFCGQMNSHISSLEKAFNVVIHLRGNHVKIGAEDVGNLHCARQAITELYQCAGQDVVSDETVEAVIMRCESVSDNPASSPAATASAESDKNHAQQDSTHVAKNGTKLDAGRTRIRLHTENQLAYVDSIAKNTVTVGIGPAGTGKTWLAVACAVQALTKKNIERIVLVRPAVEAGEKLGFLPGDLQQKVDPYLRPMFDALHEFLGEEVTDRKIDQGRIEVASLAYMRGRTLSDAFIVMDEAQNATQNQMKMLLTRIGVNSTMVVNGDVSQIDLPDGRSGLVVAQKILSQVRDIGTVYFDETDVHRSRLVSEIIKAYRTFDEQNSTES